MPLLSNGECRALVKAGDFMKVQVLKYSTYGDYDTWYKAAVSAGWGELAAYGFGDLVLNSLRAPAEFDAFDVNVICLGEEDFWKNSRGNSSDRVDSNPDLDSIAKLALRTKSTVVLVLPYDNIRFSYVGSHGFGDLDTILIKDMLDRVQAIAFQAVGPHIVKGGIVYGSGTTVVGQCNLPSYFFLDGDWDEVITTTEPPALKPTTVNDGGVIVTTLPILASEEAFSAFLGLLFVGSPDADAPAWFRELPPMLDDALYLEEIARQEAVIVEAAEKAADARSRLEENDKWKSVLYANGDQLEDVVREMLGELFRWDWRLFEDHGTSDFIFEHEGVCYAGEIKGENSNVVNSHLSQLDLNCNIDEEAGRIPEGLPCCRLLIANTFRKKPPAERPAVDEKQVGLARDKYGCLIVTTPVLLGLFGGVRSGEVPLQHVIELLSRTGILLESDIDDCSST